MAKKKLTEEEKKEKQALKAAQLALPLAEREAAYFVFEDMVDFLEDKPIEEVEAFNEVAFDENGKYQHFKARKWFLSKYFPEKIKGKEKVDKRAILMDLIEKKRKEKKKK